MDAVLVWSRELDPDRHPGVESTLIAADGDREIYLETHANGRRFIRCYDAAASGHQPDADLPDQHASTADANTDASANPDTGPVPPVLSDGEGAVPDGGNTDTDPASTGYDRLALYIQNTERVPLLGASRLQPVLMTPFLTVLGNALDRFDENFAELYDVEMVDLYERTHNMARRGTSLVSDLLEDCIVRMIETIHLFGGQAIDEEWQLLFDLFVAWVDARKLDNIGAVA